MGRQKTEVCLSDKGGSRGAWVALLGNLLFVKSQLTTCESRPRMSPAQGSVLTAQSLLGIPSLSPSLSAPPLIVVSFSQNK